jgi:hypothetical protein
VVGQEKIRIDSKDEFSGQKKKNGKKGGKKVEKRRKKVEFVTCQTLLLKIIFFILCQTIQFIDLKTSFSD